MEMRWDQQTALIIDNADRRNHGVNGLANDFLYGVSAIIAAGPACHFQPAPVPDWGKPDVPPIEQTRHVDRC